MSKKPVETLRELLADRGWTADEVERAIRRYLASGKTETIWRDFEW